MNYLSFALLFNAVFLDAINIQHHVPTNRKNFVSNVLIEKVKAGPDYCYSCNPSYGKCDYETRLCWGEDACLTFYTKEANKEKWKGRDYSSMMGCATNSTCKKYIDGNGPDSQAYCCYSNNCNKEFPKLVGTSPTSSSTSSSTSSNAGPDFCYSCNPSYGKCNYETRLCSGEDACLTLYTKEANKQKRKGRDYSSVMGCVKNSTCKKYIDGNGPDSQAYCCYSNNCNKEFPKLGEKICLGSVADVSVKVGELFWVWASGDGSQASPDNYGNGWRYASVNEWNSRPDYSVFTECSYPSFGGTECDISHAQEHGKIGVCRDLQDCRNNPFFDLWLVHDICTD